MTDPNLGILFRASLAEEKELEIASDFFRVYDSRTAIEPDSTIIARYSALPFYQELEKDLANLNSKLINSYSQHLYTADIKRWYPDLSHLTPKTYFQLSDVPNKGPFILKGATNSRKHLWNTHMFANTLSEVKTVYGRLMDDAMISEQDIYIREYVPLNKLAEGINGLPISEEYRFFFYKKNPVIGGFYWQNYIDDINPSNINPDNVPSELLTEIGEIVSQHTNFFVADIARTTDNRWILIELNDGQMSGLSCINPLHFYADLRFYLKLDLLIK